VAQSYRIREAAQLLGVSDDTLRRWIDAGRVQATTTDGRKTVIAGVDLARLAQELANQAERPHAGSVSAASARNRLVGVVTRVVKDTVMAQVEIQAGPFRIVSLMSSEAVDELGLEPGSRAVASIKATNVVVGIPDPTPNEPQRNGQ
jgi:molybdopterin-binding protein